MKDRVSDQKSGFEKCKRTAERFLPPLLLVLWSFVGVRRGLDITDTTYSLGNYVYLNRLDPMWKFATWIPNLLGAFFTKLPGGGTMVGMNVWCTLPLILTVFASYAYLAKRMPKGLLFAGEWVAVGLCWCPRVILYNYLTYFFFTLGTLFLLKALIRKEGEEVPLSPAAISRSNPVEERRELFLLPSGFFLGLNGMVRLPNVLEAALILVVFFAGFLYRKKAGVILCETGLAVLGYAAGFLLPLLGIEFLYGCGTYGKMVMRLMQMNQGAPDYTFMGMLSSICLAYFDSLKKMVPLLFLLLAGSLLFRLRGKKYRRAKGLLFSLAFLFVLRLYLANGTITRNYWYYDCLFQPAMMLLLMGMVLLLLDVGGVLRETREDRILSATALVLIWITPLGSNNYTMPVINNLFLVAPILLRLFAREWKRVMDGQRPEWHLSPLLTAAGLILVLLLQGSLFHTVYAFQDGEGGEALCAEVSHAKRASGMRTTKERAEQLDNLFSYLQKEGLFGKRQVLLFGKIPGLSYLCEMEPAIDTTWPDLDSYSERAFEEALHHLAGKKEKPVAILHDEGEEGVHAGEKRKRLQRFLREEGYHLGYQGDGFHVYLPQG
ncbi:MAG: hypothetical protein HXK83_07135 [Lachnospiraceae bacterium]|nr:hypothetical protein [Lachnospiraceae bacterium]